MARFILERFPRVGIALARNNIILVQVVRGDCAWIVKYTADRSIFDAYAAGEKSVLIANLLWERENLMALLI